MLNPVCEYLQAMEENLCLHLFLHFFFFPLEAIFIHYSAWNQHPLYEDSVLIKMTFYTSLFNKNSLF